MIDIEIESTSVKTKSGVAAKTGKAYSIREQQAWAYLLHPDTKQKQKHPVSIVLTLEDNQEPYPTGSYIMHPASIYVGSFDRLNIGRIQLMPRAPKEVKAA